VILFLDTEFTDFLAPELISLALVAEDGREFYAERSDFDRWKCSDFVQETVLPRLIGTPAVVKRTDELRESLAAWIRQFDDGTPAYVAFDYSADWILFCWALCEHVPPWLQPLNIGDFIADSLPERVLAPESADAHNALADARALRADWVDTNK
jgi:hypothetical protein